MPKKTSSILGKGANSGKMRSKRHSRTASGYSVAVKRETLATTDKRYVRRDSTAQLVEAANQHLLRAWESIHKNSVKERKAS